MAPSAIRAQYSSFVVEKKEKGGDESTEKKMWSRPFFLLLLLFLYKLARFAIAEHKQNRRKEKVE